MSQNLPKKSIRQDRIIHTLEINPAMRVHELADVLEVSAETVRRDLAELDKTGRIKRTYGGAVRTTGFEPALTERLQLHVHERERIAKHALQLIESAESIFVGGGASTLHFARALRHFQNTITVLTPSLSVAAEVATNPRIEVMVLPGVLDSIERLVHGAETVQTISRYRASIAVVGASALDANGVSEAKLTAAQVYSSIINYSDHVIVLADHSKFEQRALQSILDWGPHTTLITDTPPPEKLQYQLEDTGAQIVIAE